MNMHKIFQLSGIMALLPSEQCWGELHAYAIQLCDTEVAIRLLPEFRLRKNISSNLFHCSSIADVNSDESPQKSEPVEWLREGMPSATHRHSGQSLLTGSGVWGEFVVSPQHYFSSAHRSPCNAWSLVMWGFLWMGSLEPCLFVSNLLGIGSNVCSMVSSTSLHGWTLSPLNGFTSSLMRAQFQQEDWWALPSWSYPTKPFSFLNPGPSFYVSCCNYRI